MFVSGLFVRSFIKGGQAQFHAVKDFVGYDQNLYMHVSVFFSDEILNHVYNGYQLQRIFPFAWVHLLFKVCNIAYTAENLNNALSICNALALMISIFYFFRISKYLKWNVSTEIIAFSILFINIHTLSFIGYAPFNTDQFAFLSGIIMFDAFYKRHQTVLLCTGIIGAFIWPTLFVTALLLFLFNRSPLSLTEGCQPGKSRFLLNLMKVGAALVVLPILLLTFLQYAPVRTWDGFAEIYSGHWFGYNYINRYVTIFATICLMFFIYRMLSPFRFDCVQLMKSIWRAVTWKRAVIAIIVYLGVWVLQRSLSNDEPYWDMPGMLKHTVLRSTALPFVFLEAHLFYFGLLVVLLIFHWKKAIASYERLGVGFMALIAMFLILCVNPESRYMIFLLPFVAIPFMEVLGQRKLKAWVPWAFMGVQLLFSRFWLPIASSKERILTWFRLDDVPHYVMNGTINGAFQHVEMYLIGIVLFVIILALYYWGMKKSYFFK